MTAQWFFLLTVIVLAWAAYSIYLPPTVENVAPQVPTKPFLSYLNKAFHSLVPLPWENDGTFTISIPLVILFIPIRSPFVSYT